MKALHRHVLRVWIFAFGIFLSLASSSRAEEVSAILTAPRKLYAGGPSSLTVSTFDTKTRAPVDAAVQVSISTADGRSTARLFDGRTGAAGHRRVEFTVPDFPSGSCLLRAEVQGAGAALEVQSEISRTPAILIETDKPIYKPSQKIQGRVILLGSGLQPAAGEIEVTFHDAKGIRIDRRRLAADEYGAAAFSLDLAKEVNYGTWKIRAKCEGAEAVRDVRVEEYTLPRFDLKTSLAKSWALVDEPISGSVSARYFFGKDVEGTATVRAKRWVATWEEYASASGDLAGGAFPFELPPVGFVSGTPGASGQGTVTLEVSVTDSTGHTQDATEVVTIVEAPVVLTLVARTKTLKPKIPAQILVTSKSPDGTPMDVDVATKATFYSIWGGELGEATATVRTSGGIATFEILPPEDTGFAEVTARASAEGRIASTSLRVDGAYSPSSSFLSLSRTDGGGPAAVGQTVSFSAISTHRGTVYYEVYAAGRTVLSDATEGESFSVSVTADMVPRAKVVAYKINPDNEIAADSLSFEVLLPVSVELRADFSAAKIAPGDPVELSIDAGTARRTLLGVSLVDQSVLALGRSRLHLADVFAELERRFLEPQAEVHEGDEGGPDVGPMPGFWRGAPEVRGAFDILKDAGLAIATTEGIQVPKGGELGWWRDAFLGPEDAGNVPPAAGGAEPSAPPVRVRQYFPETWVWEPLLFTDDSGRATLRLEAPDSITSWHLSVVATAPGTGSDPGIVFGANDVTVFQDFFVEPSIPYSVVRGEIFPVKVDVFNYLDDEQAVSLELSGSEGFEIQGEGRAAVTVPANSATSVSFPIRPTKIGEFPVKVLAVGTKLSDAVIRPIRIVAEGVPAEWVANGVIEAGSSVALDLAFPPHAVEGSERAYLHVTPSPVAQTMNGVADLLGMPYGCGEQNMIFLAPDIEILKYLRETGELAPEVRATAEYYVNVGYQRQLTFRTDDGGFAAFGGEHGSLWLTAFVLSTFAGAREVRDIDEAVLEAAALMLVSRQKPDGSFQTDDFLIHKEMDGGMENVYAMAAYVANALADAIYLAPAGSEPPASVAEALAKAAAFLATSQTTLPGVRDDPYSLSIAALALGKIPGYGDAAESTIDRLLELARRDGVGIHWEPYPVETTGYAAQALLASGGGVGRPEAASAIEWLSTQRNALGGYGTSTQDTVVAIRALFLAARKVHADLDVTLSVRDGERTLFSLRIDESNYDLFHQFELPLGSSLALVSEGRGNVGYQVVRRFNLPGELLPPPRDMLMEVSYDSSHIEVDELVDVRVRLEYTGFKEKTGMVIADVGVPTGFSAVRSTLDAVVEAGAVSRFEIAGRKVIFYLESLARGQPVAFSFQILALYPVRAEGAISHVYEYYDPAVEAYHGQDPVVIHEREAVPPTFVRGDSTDDGKVDISDAVTALAYLFLGGAAPDCLDASDANDDGTLNITDPIYLLGYLFLGGPAPPAPFPEAGEDPTRDLVGCRGSSF
ncbi:MAG: alpha-2-macroglobulin family protein [Planctomycetota bacterium]